MLVTAGDGPEAERGPEPLWRMVLALGELSARSRRLSGRAIVRAARAPARGARRQPGRLRAGASLPRGSPRDHGAGRQRRRAPAPGRRRAAPGRRSPLDGGAAHRPRRRPRRLQRRRGQGVAEGGGRARRRGRLAGRRRPVTGAASPLAVKRRDVRHRASFTLKGALGALTTSRTRRSNRMCGIVGYVGEKECTPILIEGLRRLEYRGYDSAGVAVLDPANERRRSSRVVRCRGKLANLENLLRDAEPRRARSASATRAGRRTAGPATRTRTRTSRAAISVVHNGIIENHLALRAELAAKGAHVLVGDRHRDRRAPRRRGAQGRRRGDLRDAVRRALKQVQRRLRDRRDVATRSPTRSSPRRTRRRWCVGLGEGENFVASDVPAILAHTRNVIFLEEGEIADGDARPASTITDLEGKPHVERAPKLITWSRGVRRRRAASSTSCSRRSTSSRARSPTRCAAASSVEHDDVFLDGIELDVAKIKHDHVRRLRHVVARGAGRQVHDRAARAHPGRGRARVGVSLSRSDHRPGRPRRRGPPVGRDRSTRWRR